MEKARVEFIDHKLAGTNSSPTSIYYSSVSIEQSHSVCACV